MASNSTSEELLELLVCPITCQLPEDPAIAPDGYTYERKAIEQWLNHNGTSPFTGKPMTASQLNPNLKVIDLLKQRHGGPRQEEEDGSTAPSSREATPSSNAAIPAITQTASLRSIRPEAFTALDELSDLVAGDTDDFQPPQVVVVGTESHGKSTILERLAGLPIFPRDKTLCTRVPVRVRFRRGPNQCIRMWEQGVDPQSGRAKGDPTRALLAQASLVAGTQVLEQVRETMGRIMRQLNEQRGQTGVSLEHEIVVHLQGPTYPDIDLVDLPGLVEVAHAGEDPQMPQKTRALSERYLKQHSDHSMFIVALDCRMTMHTSAALRMLKDRGVLGKTLGILTKCDVYQPEDDCEDGSTMSALGTRLTQLLSATANPDFVETGYGWVLLSSKGLPRHDDPARDGDVNMRARRLLLGLSRCQTAETSFFQQHGVSIEKDAGITALCGKVTQSFENYIRDKWVPLAIARVSKASAALVPGIEALGVPFLRESGFRAADVDLDAAVHQHIVSDQELSVQLQKRLFDLLVDQKSGVYKIAVRWLNRLLDPLGQALIKLSDARKNVYESGVTQGTCMPEVDVVNLHGVALAEAEVRTTSQLVAEQLRSDAAPEDRCEHPVAVQMLQLMLSDSTTFQLHRFRTAIDGVISSISQLLREWTRACVEAVTVVAAVACTTQSVCVAVGKGSQSETEKLIRSQVKQHISTANTDLIRTLAEVCQRILHDKLTDLSGPVRKLQRELSGEAESSAEDRDWLKDDTSCQRQPLMKQLRTLALAEARLRALLPPSVDIDQMLRAKEFEQLLKKTELADAVKATIRSVFDGTCGEHLSLAGNDIRDGGAEVLGKALETNCTLQALNLYGNSIGDSGAVALGKALEKNSSLQRLFLQSNRIGDSGAAALAKALETNSTLLTISCSGNCIEDSGAAALGKALGTNSSLKELGLADNRIGNSGVAALCKALESNNSLERLFLSSNHLSQEAKQRLRAIAKQSGGKVEVQC